MKSQNTVKAMLLLAALVLSTMLMAVPAYADDTGLKNAASYATGTTGNPATNPAQALADDVATGATNDAFCALFRTQNPPSNVADSEIYYDFSFALPAGATIDGIEVIVSGYRTGTPSVGAYFRVRLDGGSGWTAYKDTSTLTTADAEYTLGDPANQWGGSWTADSFSNANFKLEIIPAGPTLNGESWKLDSVRAKVYYTVTAGSISGAKFYDADTDGVWNVDVEPPIEEWMVRLLKDDVEIAAASTDADGKFLFEDLEPGNYTVEEVFPIGTWVGTTATSFSHALEAGEEYVGPDFGNICLGPGGGHTKGYWSNKNGEETMNTIGMSSALSALAALNLVDGSGNGFDPGTYAAFESWLQAATATNMAYMLSAQLAAMKLNVMAGFVDGDALVYAPGALGANAAGFISINDLIDEANAELGTHGTAFDGDSWRDYQEDLKNALDEANNNLNFVQPEPCLPLEYLVL